MSKKDLVNVHFHARPRDQHGRFVAWWTSRGRHITYIDPLMPDVDDIDVKYARHTLVVIILAALLTAGLLTMPVAIVGSVVAGMLVAAAYAASRMV